MYKRQVEDVWRRALAAEQLVGAALEDLTAGGWEVVHSIVLPGDALISHLLIGPGGVFCVAAEQVRGARARVDDAAVRVDGEREQRPYVRRARHSAARCTMVLSRGCGYPVRVRPVLVLVGVAEVEVAPSLEDVRVLREPEVSRLGALGGVLRPDRVDRIHTVARDRRAVAGGVRPRRARTASGPGARPRTARGAAAPGPRW